MTFRKILILFASLFLVVSASATTKRLTTGQNENVVQSQNVSAKVNINTADATALETVNGIGPKKAEAIIAYRQQNGRFASIEDIAKVKGIGQKRFAKISQYLTV